MNTSKSFKHLSFAFSLFMILAVLTFKSSAIDLRQYINDYIKDYYCVESDYYSETINVNGQVLGMNLPERQAEYGKYGLLLNPLTYGSNGTHPVSGWGNLPDIGYSIYGSLVRAPFSLDINPFENDLIIESFYHWGTWSGHRLSQGPLSYNDAGMRRWVGRGCQGNPWPRGEIEAYNNQSYSKAGLQRLPDGEEKIERLENAIQTGMDLVYGNPRIKGNMIRPGYNQSLRIHDMGGKPHGNGRWVDYIIVMIPPTDISWGLGLRFNANGGKYWTIDIPIAPYNMTERFDLSTRYLTYAETANAGDAVTFIAEVNSNIEEVTDGVSYRWSITDAGGNPVSGVSYGGHGSSASGTFSIDKYYTKQFAASFTMPSSNVRVSFEVNGDKKYDETNYKNNRSIVDPVDPVTVRILQPAPPLTEGEVVLDYDIYSRDHESRLAPMTAHFAARAYEGNGEAGISSWTNNSSVLSNYNYENHFTVNSAPFTINPWYKGKLLRSGFGDNPEAKVYKANGVYPITVTQTATGQAWRRFWTAMGVDKEGNVIYGLATEWHNFPTATTHLPVRALVYNGGSVGKPYTKNEVSGANISWTSNPVTFSVYRKMYHMDLGGNRVGEKSVPGQFTRSFTAQNTASVVWSAPMTLAQGYARDRQTASNRGSNYTNAIFATDKQFARVAYPFKSGYMFNPVGTYQCVVKSTVYYDISASEAEKKSAHEELVNKVINSFVYDNNLQYTTNGKDVYDYKNVTSANRKGILNVTRNDSANITAIPHSQYQTCMEGYSESGTLQSFNNYKYREFVSKDRVSRIDAQTVITFTVGSSAKRYTYINMRDGQYPITVRSMPFSFKGLTAPGIHLSDGITVTVKGSLYDDRG